jgi:drug/metabolite transporter (DMT)-like permease
MKFPLTFGRSNENESRRMQKTARMASGRSGRLGSLLLLAPLATLWGMNYVFIGVALRGIRPALIADVRALFGATLLIAIRPQAVGTLTRTMRTKPIEAIALGALIVACPMLLINVAERHVASGPAAVIASCSPALVALVAPLVGESERLKKTQWLGILVASTGVAVLVGATPDQARSVPGLLALFGSTSCTATGTILARKRFKEEPPLDVAIMTLAVATVILAPAAFLSLPRRLPSMTVIGAVVELAVLGTAAAFVLFFSAVRSHGPGFALRPVYVSPAVAILGGAALLGDPVTIGAAAGFLIVIAGVSLISQPRPDLIADVEGLTVRENENRVT